MDPGPVPRFVWKDLNSGRDAYSHVPVRVSTVYRKKVANHVLNFSAGHPRLSGLPAQLCK